MTHRMSRCRGTLTAALLFAWLVSGCTGSIATTDSQVAVAGVQDRTVAVDAPPAYSLRQVEQPTSHAPHAPRLAMRGRGAAARIVDAAGIVAWEGSDATPLYGLEVSPDGRRALLYFGDATYSVRPVDDLTAVGTILPSRPARAGATAFGAWHWLDGDRLLGVAEIPGAGDAAAATAAEIESRSPDATVLSVFDLRDGSLDAVGAAADLPRAFMVGEVRGDYVQLLTNEGGAPAWVKVVAHSAD